MKKDNAKELGISLVRSALGGVPFAGQVLNEAMFEFRGRIKQNRLNKFTELLTEFFKNNEEVDLDNLRTEDFSDLLESVLRKVVQTKSIEKQKRFRDVLTNKIQNPLTDIDNSEIYLDLITSISEDELKVLYRHQNFDNNFDVKKNEIDRLKKELALKRDLLKKESVRRNKGKSNNYISVITGVNKINEKINKLGEKKSDRFHEYRKPDFYGLTSDRFFYCKQSLFSKGLLIDTGIGRLNTSPFQLMSITHFGSEFIKFIMKE